MAPSYQITYPVTYGASNSLAWTLNGAGSTGKTVTLSLASEVAGVCTFNWDGALVAGDVLERQASTASDFSSLYADDYHTLTEGDLAGTPYTGSQLTVNANTTWYVRGRVGSGPWSTISFVVSDAVTANYRIASTGNRRISSAGNYRKAS